MASPIVEEEKMNAVADLPAAVNAVADDNEPAGDSANEANNQERRKRKKEIIMPQREVDYALSFEPEPLEPELLASLEAMGLGLDPDLVAFREEQDRWMLAVQEDFKQQIADKGYVSTMVEVNDEDDEDDDNEDGWDDDHNYPYDE